MRNKVQTILIKDINLRYPKYDSENKECIIKLSSGNHYKFSSHYDNGNTARDFFNKIDKNKYLPENKPDDLTRADKLLLAASSEGDKFTTNRLVGDTIYDLLLSS